MFIYIHIYISTYTYIYIYIYIYMWGGETVNACVCFILSNIFAKILR